jgi:HEPN domain-containing protein
MATTRDVFRELARCRLAEAKVLLEQGHPSGAYYLAGYAIECALKAAIAAQFQANEIPDKKLVNSVYTHDLPDLLRVSGLQAELEAGGEVVKNWNLVKTWSESARYATFDEAAAAGMLDAIGDDDRGLFQWLTSRW